jgi:hypothetical protein
MTTFKQMPTMRCTTDWLQLRFPQPVSATFTRKPGLAKFVRSLRKRIIEL